MCPFVVQASYLRNTYNLYILPCIHAYIYKYIPNKNTCIHTSFNFSVMNSYPMEGGGRDRAPGETERCGGPTLGGEGLARAERISDGLSQETAGRQRSTSQRKRASARKPARCEIDLPKTCPIHIHTYIHTS